MDISRNREGISWPADKVLPTSRGVLEWSPAWSQVKTCILYLFLSWFYYYYTKHSLFVVVSVSLLRSYKYQARCVCI